MFVTKISLNVLLFVVINTIMFHHFLKRAFFRALLITHAFKQSFLVTVLPKALVGVIEAGFEPISPSLMHSHTAVSV